MNFFKKIQSVALAAIICGTGMTFSDNIIVDTEAAYSGYSLSISDAYGEPGETLTLKLNSCCNNALESIDIIIEWDRALRGSYVTPVRMDGRSYVSGNSCTAVFFSDIPITDGTIGTIDFTIPYNAAIGTEYEVRISQVHTFAEFGVASTRTDVVICSSGIITVSSDNTSVTTAATSAPATTTTTTTVSSGSLSGDANSDNTVNVRDCSTIASALASSLGHLLPKSADFNHDGDVNIRDAAAIATRLAQNKYSN